MFFTSFMKSSSSDIFFSKSLNQFERSSISGMNEFESFSRHKALERAILKSSDLIEAGDYGPVEKMFKDAAEEEMEWARYLFKDGSMLGLNDEILIQYMKHLTNKRSRAIGIGAIFEETPNPILWIKNWTESKHVQVAPQETQIETYKVGSFKQDTSDTDFSDFSF